MAPVRLHVEKWEPKVGTGVNARKALLLHGITGGVENWSRLGPYLAAKGHTTYACDLRGHGRSERADSYLYQDFVDDLYELTMPFDLVVGHSLGTTLAVLASAQKGERFAKRLVLIDPVHVDAKDMSDVRQQQLDELIDTEESIKRDHPKWSDEDVQGKLVTAHMADKRMVELAFAQNKDMVIVEEQSHLVVPTLAIAGDPNLGSTFPVADEEVLKAKNPTHWTTRRIKGAGHSVHRDDWSAFVQALDDFIS